MLPVYSLCRDGKGTRSIARLTIAHQFCLEVHAFSAAQKEAGQARHEKEIRRPTKKVFSLKAQVSALQKENQNQHQSRERVAKDYSTAD